jgi:hypothetical protein
MKKQFFDWTSFHLNEEGIFFPAIQIAYLEMFKFWQYHDFSIILQNTTFVIYVKCDDICRVICNWLLYIVECRFSKTTLN